MWNNNFQNLKFRLHHCLHARPLLPILTSSPTEIRNKEVRKISYKHTMQTKQVHSLDSEVFCQVAAIFRAKFACAPVVTMQRERKPSSSKTKQNKTKQTNKQTTHARLSHQLNNDRMIANIGALDLCVRKNNNNVISY